MSFEETYFDVLKSIEGAVVQAYQQTPDLKDRDVDAGIDGLIRYYNAALKERKPPNLKLSQPEQTVFNLVKSAVESHMSGNALMGQERPYTLEEVVQCLKRIQRSVGQMLKLHGRGGTAYLDFVKGYHNRQSE